MVAGIFMLNVGMAATDSGITLPWWSLRAMVTTCIGSVVDGLVMPLITNWKGVFAGRGLEAKVN